MLVKETTNSVAGVEGVSPGTAPVIRTKTNTRMARRTRSKFAGVDVFECDNETFCRCRFGHHRYQRYDKLLGDDDSLSDLKSYARRNPSKGIILRNSMTGALSYFRNGSAGAISGNG